MKKIYINRWLAFSFIALVGIGAMMLILHTASTMSAQYLSYLSLAGN